MNIRRLKFVIFLTFGLLLIPLVLVNYVARYLILKKLNAAAHFSVDGLSVNVFTGNLAAEGIVISDLPVDSMHVANGTVSRFSLEHFHLIRYMLHGEICLDKVTVRDSRLQLSENADGTPILRQPKSKGAAIPEIAIDSVEALNAVLSYVNRQGQHAIAHIVKGLAGSVMVSASKGKPHPEFGSLNVNTGVVQYTDSSLMYAFGARSLHADYSLGALVINDFGITPLHDKAMFAKRSGYQTDRFEGTIHRVLLQTGDPGSLVSGTLLSGYISCDSIDLTVFRDRNFPRKGSDPKKTVQQYLRSAPLQLAVDSITVSDSQIRYEEKSEVSGKTGSIVFRAVSGLLTGVSNRDTTVTLRVQARSQFMQSSDLQLDIKFPADVNYFDCNGQITGLPLPEISAMSGPGAGILFTRGLVRNLAFNLRADTDSARGDLLLEYEHLDFALQNKTTGDTTGIISKILSFIGGEILIPSSTPKQAGKPVQGVIRYARDPERFIFNYLWKSIYSGITSVVLSDYRKPKNKKNR